jgi:hypothetical protein
MQSLDGERRRLEARLHALADGMEGFRRAEERRTQTLAKQAVALNQQAMEMRTDISTFWLGEARLCSSARTRARPHASARRQGWRTVRRAACVRVS